ncbi:DUF6920 family protein [Mesobacillus jeotgali]|uniref:DUF6920 family protein n=1 Tax=Mesobacillus jeotgali TaxID=129985 RepID=UPI0009A7A9AF|nr:DUF6544 family protein [Mesobacillus jeotgali]
MSILFFILMLFHGLIHIMGWLKSFGFAEINAITQGIPKIIGVFWLFATLLFVFVAVSYLLKMEWWIIPAVIAVMTSQILILMTWQDAKFGTIPNIIIFIAIIIGFSVWRFNYQVDLDLRKMNNSNFSTKEIQIITEETITPLPLPVQKWVHNIGLIGREKVNSVYFKQKGKMKLKPDQEKWYDAVAEQYITTDDPAFLWKVKMDMFPFVSVAGRDFFINGEGRMLMKIGSLIPVVNVTNNKKVNQSTLQRYLMELPWYPSAALNDYINWESIDGNTAKATMNYKGTTGSAIYYFNENGELLKISALRFKESDKNAERIECIGEVKENNVVNGVKIPTKLNVSWVLGEEVFTWYKLEIYDVEFR